MESGHFRSVVTITASDFTNEAETNQWLICWLDKHCEEPGRFIPSDEQEWVRAYKAGIISHAMLLQKLGIMEEDMQGLTFDRNGGE